MKIKKYIAFLLVAITALACAACGTPKNNDDSSDGKNDCNVEVKDTETLLAKNGITDYRIAVSAEADDDIMTAADELVTFFKESTGATLKIVSDNRVTWSNTEKYLVIGENAVSSAAGIVPDSDLGTSGFNIETKGNSVFMVGQSSEAAIYAVYDFMYYTFGLEFFTGEAYTIEKSDVLYLKELTVKSVPSFDYRYGPTSAIWNNPQWLRRLRFVKPTDVLIEAQSDFWATTLDIVPIDEYYETHKDYFSTEKNANGRPVDVNFSNPEMWKVALENIKKLILENPGKDRIMFGMQDVTSWDQSKGSLDNLEKYGTYSSSEILCVNYLAKNVREWLAKEQPGRRVKIGIFAYNKALEAPVKSDGKGGFEPTAPEMMLDEDVFVVIAPLQTDYNYSYEDSSKKNQTMANAIKGWSVLCDDILIWGYMQNFAFYLLPFNTFNTMQGMYRFYKANNANAIYDEGAMGPTYGGTAFFELKQYLASKFAWNVDADMNDLINRFMKGFYGEAGEEMRKYYDGMISLTTYDINELGMPGGVYENLLQAKYWPKGTLDAWMTYFENAYQSIDPLKTANPERYETLKFRIDKERVSLLYILIELHSSYYTEDELREMKLEVKRICEKAGIRLRKESAVLQKDAIGGALMQDLYNYWGIGA